MFEQKGAKVIFTYPAMMKNASFLIDQPHVVAASHQLHAKLAEYDITVSCEMNDFYYDRSLFADTFYHLTEEGKRLRSRHLGECLSRLLKQPKMD